MDHLSYQTISANAATINKEWLIVDAENEVVGRLAAKLAYILRGKHKTNYTPHADCGDYVIVINADKAVFTGAKMEEKEYIRHSGYPGGQRIFTPRQMMASKPTFVVEKAVKGMLPRTRLGRAVFMNMKVYAGTEHPHQAQQPRTLDLNTIK
jgi:large subunit ribosomal protein L13